MQTKHFTVSCVLLVTIAISQLVRGQDCDPTSGCNEQSFCVASGFCSCLSGFSGDSCLVQPQSSCKSSFNDPSDANTPFDALLEYSLTLDVLNIQINTSLEKNHFVDSTATPLIEGNQNSVYSLGTTISWHGTSECAYPSSAFWSKLATVEGHCLDSYEFQLESSDTISSCGFEYDSKTNIWSNTVTITRYYSQPPDLTIMDPSRRIEARPRIFIESESFVISLPSSEEPSTLPEESDPVQDDTETQDEMEEIAPSSSDVSSTLSDNRALLIKASSAAAAGAGVCFIVIIIVVIVVRRRRSRKAQSQFNFEGIDSN